MAMITVKLNGLWIPMEVDVLLLRRAVVLPDHAIFSNGFFHLFCPNQPTVLTLENIDRREEDTMNDE
uniref:Uncharacterized protein n=1 Tax=Globisporangium ultimum (strain ATCC 200006 / CBS 805.95 / DAOM BR144) TaxID=431595 RepID=K3WAQ0_GLOUD